MRHARPPARLSRLAGLLVVLALHAALLYGLWRQQSLPPPAAAATLFVSLLQEAPKPEPPPPQAPKPPAPPVKSERRAAPPQLAAQAPVVLPGEAVAPAPAAAPTPVAEARTEPAPPPAPPRPAGPVVLDGELAVACPQRSAPAYPPYSRRLGEEGKVLLRVELDEEGRVDRAAVKTSSGFARLDDAALRAVKTWHCNPARRDGIAQRAVALQPFNFVLEGR